MPSLASPKRKESQRSLCSPLPCLSVACVADDGIIQAADYGFVTVAGASCGTAPVLAQADQSRVVTGFSHLLGVIHKLYIVYTQSKFTLCRETGYSSYVSSTLPKDGFKPAAFIPVGFFLTFPSAQRKNPQSITMRASPVFSLPSSWAWILWTDNEGKCLSCLHAMQHRLMGKKKPAGLGRVDIPVGNFSNVAIKVY
jgi:hypothetical protein